MKIVTDVFEWIHNKDLVAYLKCYSTIILGKLMKPTKTFSQQ